MAKHIIKRLTQTHTSIERRGKKNTRIHQANLICSSWWNTKIFERSNYFSSNNLARILCVFFVTLECPTKRPCASWFNVTLSINWELIRFSCGDYVSVACALCYLYLNEYMVDADAIAVAVAVAATAVVVFVYIVFIAFFFRIVRYGKIEFRPYESDVWEVCDLPPWT